MTNSANARIFGSDNDAVFVAPHGTALPTDLAALPAAFVDAGWLSPDGIAFQPSDSVEKFRGHQGGRVIRTKITESDTTFVWQALETKLLTLGLQFDITDHVTVGGVSTLKMSSGRKIATRTIVIDTYDGDNDELHYRFCVATAEIGERAEFSLANNSITGYSFTTEVIGELILITNDEALVLPTP